MLGALWLAVKVPLLLLGVAAAVTGAGLGGCALWRVCGFAWRAYLAREW